MRKKLLLFIVAVIILTNKTMLTIAVTAGILYVVFREYKKIQARNYEKGKNELDQKAAIPFITKYCDSAVIAWGKWPPANISSSNDLDVIQHIILEETGRRIDTVDLNIILNRMLYQRASMVFNNSFKKLLDERYLSLSEDNIIILFCEIYPPNSNMQKYLEKFLESNGFVIDKARFPDRLKTIYQNLSIRRKADALNSVLASGKALNINATITDVDKMDGLAFEHFLCKLFTNMGYVASVTKSSGDQGADLLLEKLGKKIVVQAKRYSNKLDNTPVQEVVGAKAYYGYSDAMVVTNSTFTDGARELAGANAVRLIDRHELTKLLKEYPVAK